MVEPHGRPTSTSGGRQHAYPAVGLLCVGGGFMPPVYVHGWRARSSVESPSEGEARAR